ncbi:aldehyde dehydrogenase family protein [Nubsella zeaxanthinifaciens]|uniref:aldehyde dehydrogenase family protein n=1 Tax=Nubsella zeaxanthinifaciens TaxID=392412 RepID=UPI0018E52B63|nr:aldehyde dehydrogenase family protein [Nubsella zeaxanthinifaciens]
MYINGDFVKAKSGKTRDIINPANGKVMATVPEAQPEDVFEAVIAAREAFDGQEWSSKTALERQDLMLALAQKIRDKFDFFVELETQNNGKPKREAEFDIDDSINCLKFYAGLATKIHGETMSVPANSFSFVTREPIGVCAQIIPWNFPFLMLVWKIAPALITGNTVVLKPSEITPLTALEFAKCFDEVGFPKGVLNIITGDGTVAGNALISDTRIDKIAFTGGTNTGKHIAKIAAENLKKVTLELGGKNPVIIFDDANLDLTVDWALFAAFANSGQVCTAGSRLLVHADIYDVFVQKFVEGAKKIKLGNGLLSETTMGPVVSKAHFDKIMNYIQIGKSEANLAFGGNGNSENGYFIEPTIFVDVKPSDRIAKEEIFGPVVAIMKFESEEEAIHLANDTEYGLGFGIFTQNITKVHRISPKIKAGIGWVNWYHPTFNEMPWGGYKQSGTGRELGLYGIENYLEVKQVNINLDTDPVGWY